MISLPRAGTQKQTSIKTFTMVTWPRDVDERGGYSRSASKDKPFSRVTSG